MNPRGGTSTAGQAEQTDAASMGSIPGRHRAIGRAGVIIMLGNLTTSILGFVRLAVIVKVFGSTLVTGAFFAASIVPQMFYDLTIGSAISAALIPTFSELVERGDRERLWRTFGAVLALAWTVLAVVVVVLMIAARPLMTAILWGYQTHLRAGAFNQSVEMAHMFIPSLFFLGTSAILLSTLYSLRRFTGPAFATVCYHLGVIAGAVLLARPLGALSLAVGALAGAASQMLFQLPPLLKARPRLTIRLQLTPEVRRIVRLYLPVAAGLVVSIVGQVLDMAFKSQLSEAGGIPAMQIATTLTQFPIGIAVAALSFAVLPPLSADAAFDRMSEFKDTLALGMRLVLFLTIPAAVAYLVLATPIVALLFERGHFHHGDTLRAAAALVGYAIQIPFVGLDQLLIFSFYARKNTLTPMLVGVLGVSLYIVSALLLMPRFQILGLALANTIQNSLHAVILLGLLFGTIGTLGGRGVTSAVSRALLAALAMAATAAVASMWLEGLIPGAGLLVAAIHALVPLGVGAAAYLLMAALLKSDELRLVLELGRRIRA